MAEVHKGHCLCGAVRWEARGTPKWCCYCHCDSCRRNCAAPVTAFFGVANENFAWTGAPAQTYKRADVLRHFCGACGTPMAYEAGRFPGEIHVYLAHLEDAGALQPTFHVHHAEAVSWARIKDRLPRYPGSGNDGGAVVVDH